MNLGDGVTQVRAQSGRIFGVNSTELQRGLVDTSKIAFGIGAARSPNATEALNNRKIILPDVTGQYNWTEDGLTFSAAGIISDNPCFVGITINQCCTKMKECDGALEMPLGNGDTHYYARQAMASLLTEGMAHVNLAGDAASCDEVWWVTKPDPSIDNNGAGWFSGTQVSGSVQLQNASWYRGGIAGETGILSVNKMTRVV